MKDMAATASEARSFSKLLRIIVAGALVLTFFNTTLMAYADGDEDSGDNSQVPVVLAEDGTDSGSESATTSETPSEPEAPDTIGTGSSMTNSDDYENVADRFKDQLTSEIEGLFNQGSIKSENNPDTYNTYTGIYLEFDLNGGDKASGSDIGEQYYTYDSKWPFESVSKDDAVYYDDKSYKGQSNKAEVNDKVYINHGNAVEFILPSAKPVKEGSEFQYWQDKATGQKYNPGESFFAWFNSILVAIWGDPEPQADPDDPTPVVPGTITPNTPGTPGGTTPTTPTAGGTGGTPVAPVQMTSLGDNGNPLGVFDAGHGIYCWVHWWILLGMLITCAASVLVLNRRERHISKLNKIENDILENRTAVPSNAGSVYVPVGAQA